MQTCSWRDEEEVLRASAWRGEEACGPERSVAGVRVVAERGVVASVEEEEVEKNKVAVPCSCP